MSIVLSAWRIRMQSVGIMVTLASIRLRGKKRQRADWSARNDAEDRHHKRDEKPEFPA